MDWKFLQWYPQIEKWQVTDAVVGKNHYLIPPATGGAEEWLHFAVRQQTHDNNGYKWKQQIYNEDFSWTAVDKSLYL